MSGTSITPNGPTAFSINCLPEYGLAQAGPGSGSDYPQIADKHGRRIILDTGAPHAVYISKKRWNAIKLAYPDAFVSVYSGYSPAAGGFYAHECMHVSSFQLGPLELKNILLCESFANPEVMGIPDDIDIILGYGARFPASSGWSRARDAPSISAPPATPCRDLPPST